MREAFRRAVEKKPGTKIEDILKKVDRSQYKERRAERHAGDLERMGGRFERIGSSWLYLRLGPLAMPPIQGLTSDKKIREEWQRLQTPLVNMSKNERPQMISKLTDGLELSEEGLNAYYRQLVVGEILDNPLGQVQEMFSKTRFSSASKAFFGVLSDISGYSKEQRTSFKDFMNKRKDLRGSVSLPQTFPAIAEWFVQQSNVTKQT